MKCGPYVVTDIFITQFGNELFTFHFRCPCDGHLGKSYGCHMVIDLRAAERFSDIVEVYGDI